MARYVYVLVAAEADRYTAMCQLSATSVRGVDPAARITLLTDESTARWLHHGTHGLSKIADDILVGKISGSNQEISRVLKTTMLQRVGDDFIFLDTDTLAVKPFAGAGEYRYSMQMALDRFARQPEPGFPQWVVPHYKRLGWTHPTTHYFNSGVMFVRNDAVSGKLFEEWHRRWRDYQFATGKTNDQPALNSAIHELEIPVGVLPVRYNAMVRVNERHRWGAKVLHFFAEAFNNDGRTEYERLIQLVMSGAFVSAYDLQIAMARRVPLVETWSIRRHLELGNVYGAWQLWRNRGETKRHFNGSSRRAS